MISLCCALLATTAVYRLELTDEIPYIVGEDGAKRRVVIVEPDEYALLTNRLESVWSNLHATKEGRIGLHGKIVETRIENGNKVEVHEDGYTKYTRAERKTSDRRKVFVKSEEPKSVIAVRPANISDSQWTFMQKLAERKATKPKVVTVEHDAATGKDIVK